LSFPHLKQILSPRPHTPTPTHLRLASPRALFAQSSKKLKSEKKSKKDKKSSKDKKEKKDKREKDDPVTARLKKAMAAGVEAEMTRGDEEKKSKFLEQNKDQLYRKAAVKVRGGCTAVCCVYSCVLCVQLCVVCTAVASSWTHSAL
jgi:hypothetical protein